MILLFLETFESGSPDENVLQCDIIYFYVLIFL